MIHGGRVPVFVDEGAPADVEALVDLERRCASHPWTERHFRSELAAEYRARTVVARHAGGDGGVQVVGFCAFRLVADELHIHNLAVAPEHRRRHVARVLLGAAMAAGVRAAARWAMLEVRAGNAVARRLYESEGFAEAGRRRAYYADPVEDAVVMRRAL
jgi:[ribosomal protein S18]-alanine N-acetyltransferase